jgi:hypothetical protein
MFFFWWKTLGFISELVLLRIHPQEGHMLDLFRFVSELKY